MCVAFVTTVETEPRRVLDIECNHLQLPNGLIVINATWTIPSDSATLESIEKFIIWEHYFPDKNIEIGTIIGRRAEDVSYQVIIGSSYLAVFTLVYNTQRGELTYTWPTHTYPQTASNKRILRIWVSKQFDSLAVSLKYQLIHCRSTQCSVLDIGCSLSQHSAFSKLCQILHQLYPTTVLLYKCTSSQIV